MNALPIAAATNSQYLDFAGASDAVDDIPKLKNALKAEPNRQPNSSTSTLGVRPLNHPRLTKQDLQHVVIKQAGKDLEIWGLEFVCVLLEVQIIHHKSVYRWCGMKSLSCFINKAQDTICSEMDSFGLMNGSMKASNISPIRRRARHVLRSEGLKSASLSFLDTYI